MTEPASLDTAIDRFIEERYEDCIAILSCQEDLNFTARQLFLISLVRTGQRRLIDSMLDGLLSGYHSNSLEAYLIRLSVGKPDTHRTQQEDKLLRSSADRCQLHFYMSEMMRTLGFDAVAMRGAMLEAALTDADCPEHSLAERIVCEVHGDRELLLQNRLLRLFSDGDRLTSEGKESEAIARFNEALALALKSPDAPVGIVGNLHMRLGLMLANQEHYFAARPHLEAGIQILTGGKNDTTVAALTMLGKCHQNGGHYEAAICCYQDAHDLEESFHGEGSSTGITLLDNMAYATELKGDLHGAARLLETVVRLRAKSLGPQHQSTLDSSTEWFRLLVMIGDRDSARAVAGRVSTAASGRKGKADRRIVEALNEMATACHELSQAELCIECASLSVEVARQVFDQDAAEMTTLRCNLAEAYRLAGEFEKARRLNEEYLHARRSRLGSRHPDVALSLNNLAQVLQALGECGKALELMTEALEVDRAAFGPSHDTVAGDLHNIGVVLVSSGDYLKARQYFWEAIDIWRNLHPEGHSHLGIALGNLGRVYLALGDAVGAQRVLDESLAMLRGTAGKTHAATMATLASLAEVEHSKLKGEKARTMLESAIGETENQLGAAHPDMLFLRMKLARIGGHDASRLVNDSLSYVESRVQGTQIQAALLFGEKAELSAKAKDFNAAEKEFLEALRIADSLDGISMESQAQWLFSLGAVQAVLGNLNSALASMRRATEQLDAAWTQLSFAATEEDREGLRGTTVELLAHVLTLLVDHMPHSTDAANLALDCSLRYRGLQTTLVESERLAARNDFRPDIQRKFQELRRIKDRIHDDLMVNPGSKGAVVNLQQVKEWQRQYRRLAEELASLVTPATATDSPNLKSALLSRLPGGAAFIEITQFEHCGFRDWTVGRTSALDRFILRPRYVVFVLRQEQPASLTWTLAGEEGEIYVLADDLLRYARNREPDGPEIEPSRQGLPIPGSLHEAGLALRRKVLDGLDAIWNCERLVIAPDGILANIPFELLPHPQGGMLMDHCRISYVTCGRDVSRFGEARTATGAKAVVIAAPDFDLLDQHRPISRSTLGAFVFALASGADRHFQHYEPLATTIDEATEVARQLGAKLWVGADANRTNLISIRSPGVLHLATHAFFPDWPGEDTETASMIDSLDISLLSTELMEPAHLIKSGLALAGANWKVHLVRQLVALARDDEYQPDFEQMFPRGPENDILWRTSDPDLFRLKIVQKVAAPVIMKILDAEKRRTSSNSDDAPVDPALQLFVPPENAGNGVLTAEDASWLDLSGTDLVVLSACGTGLGIQSLGDGAMGLKRSFFVAGARTLICSLWKVPDRQTAALMRDFYRFALEGDDCDEALRKAKLNLRRRYPDQPYYWSAFVCYGAPAPLSEAVRSRGMGQPCP